MFRNKSRCRWLECRCPSTEQSLLHAGDDTLGTVRPNSCTSAVSTWGRGSAKFSQSAPDRARTAPAHLFLICHVFRSEKRVPCFPELILILNVFVLHEQVREIGLTGVDMVRAMTSDDAEDLGLRGVTRKV